MTRQPRDPLDRLRAANPVADPDLLVHPSVDEPLDPQLQQLLQAGRTERPTDDGTTDHSTVRHLKDVHMPSTPTIQRTDTPHASRRIPGWAAGLAAAAVGLAAIVGLGQLAAPDQPEAPEVVAPVVEQPTGTLDSAIVFGFTVVWDEVEEYYGPTSGTCGADDPDYVLRIHAPDGTQLASAQVDRGKMAGEMRQVPVYCSYSETFADLPAYSSFRFVVLDAEGDVVVEREVSQQEALADHGLVMLEAPEASAP